MSESHWHEADPEIYTLCPECGDNGIQLILWWIKMTAREQKSGKMFGCWLLYHYRGYFCQLPWPGCAIVHFPCLWLLSFKFFPWISFHCTILAKSTLWKLKMWTVNSLTQWMALSQQSSHYCVYLRTFTRDQAIDQWHGDKKCWWDAVML